MQLKILKIWARYWLEGSVVAIERLVVGPGTVPCAQLTQLATPCCARCTTGWEEVCHRCKTEYQRFDVFGFFLTWISTNCQHTQSNYTNFNIWRTFQNFKDETTMVLWLESVLCCFFCIFVSGPSFNILSIVEKRKQRHRSSVRFPGEVLVLDYRRQEVPLTFCRNWLDNQRVGLFTKGFWLSLHSIVTWLCMARPILTGCLTYAWRSPKGHKAHKINLIRFWVNGLCLFCT